jgi:ABC-type lipoprotein export system ATPase subunit
MATHDPELARDADRKMELSDGRVIKEETKSEVRYQKLEARSTEQENR